MKNVFTSFLTMACLLLGAAAANAYDFQAGGIYYSINTGGNSVTVTTGDNGFRYSGNITIPATVTNDGKTYNVTAISYRAFDSCNEMESIIICCVSVACSE